MVHKWRPVWLFAAVLGLLAGIATAIPTGVGSALAEETLQADRLGLSERPQQFVAFDDDDEEAGDGEYDQAEDGHGDDRWEGDEDREEEDEQYEDDREKEEREEWDRQWDEERERLEQELAYLELKRAELQASFGELELMREVTDLVRDHEATAVLAVISTTDEIGEPEKVAEFLRDLLRGKPSPTVRRLIQLRLAESLREMGQEDRALAVVRELVLGDGGRRSPRETNRPRSGRRERDRDR